MEEPDDDFHLVDHEPNSFELSIKPIVEFELSASQGMYASNQLEEELIKCKDTAGKQAATIALLQKRVSCQETTIENYTISLMSTTVQHQTAQESVARLEMECGKLQTLNEKYMNVIKYLQDKTAVLKTLNKDDHKADPEEQNFSDFEDATAPTDQATDPVTARYIEAIVSDHEASLEHVLSHLKTKVSEAEDKLSECHTALSALQHETKQSLAQLKADRDRYRNRSTQLEEELNRKVYELNTLKEFNPVPNRRPRPIDHAMYAAHGPQRVFMHDLFNPLLFR
jgi:DNA repair exonuclease SbcCD ATPase subunit